MSVEPGDGVMTWFRGNQFTGGLVAVRADAVVEGVIRTVGLALISKGGAASATRRSSAPLTTGWLTVRAAPVETRGRRSVRGPRVCLLTKGSSIPHDLMEKTELLASVR